MLPVNWHNTIIALHAREVFMFDYDLQLKNVIQQVNTLVLMIKYPKRHSQMHFQNILTVIHLLMSWVHLHYKGKVFCFTVPCIKFLNHLKINSVQTNARKNTCHHFKFSKM